MPGVSFSSYVVATFLKIIPASLICTGVGNPLDAMFDGGDTPDFGTVFNPTIISPISGLALLTILPVVYKKIRGGQTI